VYPEIFHWGLLRITSYGLLLAVAFLVGTWLTLRDARRLRLDEDRVVTLVLVVLVAGVLGARALYVLEHIGEFRGRYLSVLSLWQGGLTLYGGIAGGIVAGLLAAHRLRLPRWITADALAPSIALGTMFGRIGCFLNGCCYGRPTGGPWGVVFPPDSFAGLAYGTQPLHPAQLYFSAAGLAVFALAWGLRRRPLVPGTLFWGVIALLALVRIPLDLTRAYEESAIVVAAGPVVVTESQITSVVIVLFSLLMVLRLRRQVRPTPDAGTTAP
jgi:phosphatidylglycerol---prolipoprotein diacylglyceryl transferase